MERLVSPTPYVIPRMFWNTTYSIEPLVLDQQSPNGINCPRQRRHEEVDSTASNGHQVRVRVQLRLIKHTSSSSSLHKVD